ncbi:class I SAM-dependent RNA methyltransferase [Sphingomonas nostoxanthinifaciens]|uniref:class I SAM-dependent RNA methyltransferase n=1 Tax=Sphingomonas nostoxanthinifaciens TaxID=2872652 RepID=UPI001CC1C647|nr:class I SAM-dependent RNA methyltransferase [Sphingomonas nostoxanthinifaciens]UAK26208.1 class I SAM-dependent RNA methyltransferase [Sphingomonas nostoxanthinifaciens]
MTDATVIRLAPRGEGLTDDGRYIALAAPGDRVTADGTVTPGPHRATPPCRHFPRCGGCQLQHVDDVAYADYLTGHISGALAAQNIALPTLRPPHLSPPRTRRRASFRMERIGRKILIGFNEGATHKIVDMRECHVLDPRLFALVEPLRTLFGPMLREKRQAGLRLTLCDQGIDMAVDGVTVEGLAATEALTAFAERHALARLSIDEGYGLEARWEPQPASVTIGSVSVPLPAAAFLQATADGEAALAACVTEAVGDAAAIADLFAGLGTFALPLAAHARVLAVEGARDPALALRTAVNRAGLMVAVEHRDLFRRPLDAAELSRFDAVVLDPPRAGAREQMPALAKADVARLAYVSCNPATFARDARVLLDGGWRLDWIRPVGQFRWSTHVELAAAFTR